MDENVKIRKSLQKIVNYVLEDKKYSDFEEVEVSLVNKAPYKTAMCDITYELVIYTDLNYKLREDLVKEFQIDIKKYSSSIMTESICAIDIKFLKTYSP